MPSDGARHAGAFPDELEDVASAYELFRVDLQLIFGRLWARKFVLFGVVAFIASTAIAVAIMWPKTYRAEVMLLPASSELGSLGAGGLGARFSGVASLAGIDLGGDKSDVEALALLQSRGFVEAFIRDEMLLPVLFSEDWDSTNKLWTTKGDAEPTLWKGYDYFRRRILRVQQNQLTHVITLSVDWRDRVQAAQWANALTQRLNEAMRQRAIAESRRSLKFLDSELKSTTLVTVHEAISRLMEAQLRSIMLANARDEYSLKVVDKARVPDARDFRWPNRPLIIGVGVLLGLIFGTALALLTSPRRHE